MLILRKGNYTYFIDNNWVIGSLCIITFLGTSFIASRIARRRELNQLNKVRGGDIVDCIDPSNLYEITDSQLISTIRRILKEPKGPLVINAAVFFTALVISKKLNVAFRFGAWEGLLTDVQSFILKTIAFGGPTAIFGLYWGSAILTLNSPAVLTIFLLSIISISPLTAIDCEKFLAPIPKQQESSIVYVDHQSSNSSKVFMAPIELEKFDIFHSEKFSIETCETLPSVETLGENEGIIDTHKVSHGNFRASTNVENTGPKPKSITRKSNTEKKYVPLKDRTKTLKDIKKGDERTVRDQVNHYSNRLTEKFEKKRKLIMRERISTSSKTTYDDDFLLE